MLNVGRLARAKNQGLLIRSINGIDRDVSVQIVGVGWLRQQLEKQVADYGLESTVEFLGNPQQVTDIFRRADIYVLSSDYEGLPLSVLEAMRTGLPVVATDVGGVSEAVIDSETGFLVPRGDAEALRSKIQQLIDDPLLRTKMGQNGRRHYLEKFTARRMTDRTGEIYEKLLSHITQQ